MYLFWEGHLYYKNINKTIDNLVTKSEIIFRHDYTIHNKGILTEYSGMTIHNEVIIGGIYLKLCKKAN